MGKRSGYISLRYFQTWTVNTGIRKGRPEKPRIAKCPSCFFISINLSTPKERHLSAKVDRMFTSSQHIWTPEELVTVTYWSIKRVRTTRIRELLKLKTGTILSTSQITNKIYYIKGRLANSYLWSKREGCWDEEEADKYWASIIQDWAEAEERTAVRNKDENLTKKEKRSFLGSSKQHWTYRHFRLADAWQRALHEI